MKAYKAPELKLRDMRENPSDYGFDIFEIYRYDITVRASKTSYKKIHKGEIP
jgi:hypothetical protein